MADKLTVGELVYKISGDMDNLKTELKKSEAEVSKLKSSMEKTGSSTESVNKKMTKSLGMVGKAFGAFIAGTVIKGTVELVKSGAQLDSLTGSFNRLTKELGISSQETLNSLRKLSAGTITDAELITSANRAMVLGVAKNTEEFGQLMQIARLRARDMGLTTTQAFNDIVTGIGRASPMILDNLGITIKAEEAQNIYAASIGKTSKELTENEKKEALKFAVLKQGAEQLERVGDLNLTYSERLQQVTTTVTNLKDRLGKALLPAMESVLSSLDLSTSSSEELDGKFSTLSKTVYQITNFLTGLVRVVKVVAMAFAYLQKIQVDVYKTMFAWGKDIVGTVKNIGDVFSGLWTAVKQGVKGDFSGALETIKDQLGRNTKNVTEELKLQEYTLKEYKDEFVKAMQDVGDSFGEAFNPKKFKEATGTVSNATGQMIGGMDDLGGSAGATAEEIEAAAKAVEEFQNKLINLIDQSRKTSKELDGELTESFQKFSESIKENFGDSVTSLAQIVVDAEQKIADLRAQISEETDAKRRDELQKELDAQNKILTAREGFEQRQAERIADIRAKLAEAGIDAEKAGLDDLLNIQSLQEQIDEERRRASLTEFERFEEDQANKLSILVNNFIAENTLIQEKITKQKEFEDELTKYLASEESVRLENTDSWAKSTIDKYGQVAQSLQELISLKSRLGDISASVSSQTLPSTPATTSPTSTTSNINNSKTINAPVTINAPGASTPLDYAAISQEMGFEIKRL